MSHRGVGNNAAVLRMGILDQSLLWISVKFYWADNSQATSFLRNGNFDISSPHSTSQREISTDEELSSHHNFVMWR